MTIAVTSQTRPAPNKGLPSCKLAALPSAFPSTPFLPFARHVARKRPQGHLRQALSRRSHRPRQQAAEGRRCGKKGPCSCAVPPVRRLTLCHQLRFYGVIQAFRNGRLPDNKQIDETLRYVHDNSPVDVDALSPDGKRLIQDVRDIVETARKIVQTKNADELFQNFLWHTRDVDVSQAKPSDPSAVTPIDQAKAKADGRQATEHLRTLLNLVLTNSEARKLLGDFAVIGRDLFAQGAAKAADMARPDQDRMARVDHAAPHNEFVTEGGRRTTDTSETPVLEANVPDPRPGQGGAFTVKQHPREPLGTGANVVHPDGTTRSGQDVANQARTKQGELSDAAREGQDRAQAEADQVRAEADQYDDPNAKKDVAKGGLKDRFTGLKDNLMNRVPQEHKDKAGDKYQDTKNWLADEYFPEERRDQFIYRGKKVSVCSPCLFSIITHVFVGHRRMPAPR